MPAWNARRVAQLLREGKPVRQSVEGSRYYRRAFIALLPEEQLASAPEPREAAPSPVEFKMAGVHDEADARLTLTSRGQRGTGGTTVATGARKRPPLRLSAHGGDDGAGYGMR